MAIETSMYSRFKLPDFVGQYREGVDRREAREARAAAQEKQEKLDAGYNKSLQGTAFEGTGAQGFQAKNSIDKSQYEQELRMYDQIDRRLGAVTDQNSYSSARQWGIENNIPNADQMPEQYDPSFVRNIRGRSLSYADQIAKEAQDRGFQLQTDQFEYGKKKDQRDFGLREKELWLKNAKAEREAKTTPLTKGLEAADKEYGKQYVNYTKSGRTNAINTIEKLKQLQMEVAQDTGFGEAGGTRFPIPDMFRSRLAIERRDDARNFANKTLKELFGGQLSDGEREAAAREYWNDDLDNESNAKRLMGKIKELEDNVRAQDAQAQFFQENGTLAGFQYTPIDNQEIADKYASQQEKTSGMLGMKTANASESEYSPPAQGTTQEYNGVTYKLVGDEWVAQGGK